MTQRPKQPPVKHAEKMRRKSIEQKHLQAAKGGRIDVPFLLLVLLLVFAAAASCFEWLFPWAASTIPMLQEMSNYTAI